ncbi:MAG: 50S ribosomal protein L6 [Fibrobacteria bacterium]|nr:50S ribosomal protein L6 [Fibrobacteria bacterium]
MSRIGKAIIQIPDSVKVSFQGQTVSVEGPKGKLSHCVDDQISFKLEDKILSFQCTSTNKKAQAFYGTSRAIVANLVKGVSEGFTKNLEIVGVGYRGEQKGKSINFLLGYSHPILFDPPKGIELKMDGNNKVSVSGADKCLVGQVAANIRDFRPPEPYKGKGVRYADEYVRRKEVKKA